MQESIIPKKTSNTEVKSRPQQNLWSFDLMLTCLLILTIVLFLLTLYSIVQANPGVFQINNSAFFSLRILDTASAASLFVTLLGALLVRHQFAIGVLPRLNYISTTTERQNKQHPGVLNETWRVEISNTGLGPAIINRTEYILELTGAKRVVGHCSFEDLIKELSNVELMRDCDYWIENISSGYSLSPKDSFPVFEMKIKHTKKIKRLGLVVYFQGQLGDKYYREIVLVP